MRCVAQSIAAFRAEQGGEKRVCIPPLLVHSEGRSTGVLCLYERESVALVARPKKGEVRSRPFRTLHSNLEGHLVGGKWALLLRSFVAASAGWMEEPAGSVTKPNGGNVGSMKCQVTDRFWTFAPGLVAPFQVSTLLHFPLLSPVSLSPHSIKESLQNIVIILKQCIYNLSPWRCWLY